jgi:hypothetical protein
LRTVPSSRSPVISRSESGRPFRPYSCLSATAEWNYVSIGWRSTGDAFAVRPGSPAPLAAGRPPPADGLEPPIMQRTASPGDTCDFRRGRGRRGWGRGRPGWGRGRWGRGRCGGLLPDGRDGIPPRCE